MSKEKETTIICLIIGFIIVAIIFGLQDVILMLFGALLIGGIILTIYTVIDYFIIENIRKIKAKKGGSQEKGD